MSNAPEPTYTFEDLGLTPSYMKRTLEDLASDQMRTEADLAKMASTVRLIPIVGGIACMAMGLALINLKMNKAIVNAVQQIGGAVLTTQQYVGMLSQENPTMAAQPMGPVSTEPRVVQPEDGLYDPGPQEPPEHVKQALLDEPVADLLDDDTPDH